ncbi:MAG: lysozyme inhibitor LprI family protein [Sarcina sp.]
MDRTLRILLKIILGTIVIGIFLRVFAGLFSLGVVFGASDGIKESIKNGIEAEEAIGNNSPVDMIAPNNSPVTSDVVKNNDIIAESNNVKKNEESKVAVDSNDDKKTNKENSGKLDKLDNKSKSNYYKIFSDMEKKASEITNNAGHTTPEMRAAEGEIYKLWDDELNVIYNNLKKQLSADKFKTVEKEEVNWIKFKEAEGEKAAKEYEGGTIAPLMRISKLSQLTKERCYELINQNLN